MKTVCTIALFATLVSAAPDGPDRIRYRRGSLEPVLVDARAGGRLVLVTVSWPG